MRRAMGATMLVAGLMLVAGGCAKREPKPQAHAAAAAPVPADSPLAKVQMGMSEQQVRDILGPPTAENQYVSGKAFIPFYYGPDRTRRAYFYKGIGRVVFAGGSGFNMTGKVSRVEYDPSESGVAR